MKKTRIKTIILFICFSASNVSATDFLKISLDEALVKASKENKNILLYFHAKWCGPCRLMEKTVFPNDSITIELRNKYISLEIDGDSWVGERLTKEYRIAIYPTFLILNSQKEVLKRHTGAMKVTEFRAFIFPLEKYKTDSVIQKKENVEDEHWNNKIHHFSLKPGIKVGITSTHTINYSDNAKLGYDFGLILAMEKGRLLFRPGLSLLSKGGKVNGSKENITYLQLPIDFGLSVYKGGFLGLPGGGGIRILASPFVSVLINKKGSEFKKLDYGFRYGVGGYFGGSSKLELLLISEIGLTDIADYDRMQSNRLIGLSILLTLDI